MPTRVLDISRSPEIKLIETQGMRGKYATLSHCWGTNSESYFTTSRDNMEERMLGIDVGELPPTFRDAVTVARHLGLKYLWIDSLCICQDDRDDWARESGAMTALYSNAYFCIAADSATNSSDGFLHRDARRFVPIPVEADESHDSTAQVLAFPFSRSKAFLDRRIIELGAEPLTSRAWATQERLLPRRVLHYATDQMYFECNYEFLSEDGFHSSGRYTSLHPGPPPSHYPVSRESRHSSQHQLWYKILEDYSGRSLTRPSDRLPALSGLARLFENRIGATYVAGLWRDAIVEGLSWQAVSMIDENGMVYPAQEESFIAPSWSWISFPGRSGHGMTQPGWEDVAIVVDCFVQAATANPYGELKEAWIKLSAPIFEVTLSQASDPDQVERTISLCTKHGDPFGGYVILDRKLGQNEAWRAWLRSRSLFILVLSVKMDEERRYWGLFLEAGESGPLLSEDRYFRRLGGIFIGEEDLSKDEEAVVKNPRAFQTVTLV
jgi:hypothetical protein